MKKQLLTAAVAAAVALPMIAQAGVYGRNDGVVRYVDDGTDENWDVGVDKMRWGIVGSEDLGNGMKAIYHYEWAMDNDGVAASTSDTETTRLAYVGLEGGFGKLVIGRNWMPSYGAVWNVGDIFDTFGTGSSQNNLSGNRIGSQVQYYTPNMSGFTGSVAAVLSDEESCNDSQEDTIDLWEITGEYKAGPLAVGATFRNDQRGFNDSANDVEGYFNSLGSPATRAECSGTSTSITAGQGSDNDVDSWGIGARYSMDALKVEAMYGNSDPGSGAAETDVWAIAGTYSMGDTNINAAYFNNEKDGGREIDTWAIGVNHFLSKETRIFAEWKNVDDDSKSDEEDTFAFGLRKDWKL